MRIIVNPVGYFCEARSLGCKWVCAVDVCVWLLTIESDTLIQQALCGSITLITCCSQSEFHSVHALYTTTCHLSTGDYVIKTGFVCILCFALRDNWGRCYWLCPNCCELCNDQMILQCRMRVCVIVWWVVCSLQGTINGAGWLTMTKKIWISIIIMLSGVAVFYK